MERELLTATLAAAGCVAAAEEATELLAAAAGDDEVLAVMLGRRLAGEPLAWIVGTTTFCGLEIVVHPGVYVPRWQSEPLAWRAVARLPDGGRAVELCAGCGAIAALLRTSHPTAQVMATDLLAAAVACARANGVECYRGDLFAALPAGGGGPFDVVVAVVPYVPDGALATLPSDTLAFEDRSAYGGGPDGTDLLRRVVADSAGRLVSGGALLLELGDRQHELLAADLAAHGFGDLSVLEDEDGDVRGIEVTLGPRITMP